MFSEIMFAIKSSFLPSDHSTAHIVKSKVDLSLVVRIGLPSLSFLHYKTRVRVILTSWQ
jgi:hypothetical protein